MPGWCMSRAAASRICIRIHSRVRSPIHHYNKAVNLIKGVERSPDVSPTEFSVKTVGDLPELDCGNRVMVVVDSTPEAKGALDWALSHTVQTKDVLTLLHVAKQEGRGSGKNDQRAYDLLSSMKNMCQLKRPEVHVQMAFCEGKEKGATIVKEARRLGVSLLVLGHRKQCFLRHLQTIWSRKRRTSRVVDYCIQNANCMTIAVRRKNRKYGGYLITTKRHKNFWLLA